MDLKPSNVVISVDHGAVLIDLGGRGITQEWLSPKMRDEDRPWAKDLGSRIQNDIWAFGAVLSRMADASLEQDEAQTVEGHRFERYDTGSPAHSPRPGHLQAM